MKYLGLIVTVLQRVASLRIRPELSLPLSEPKRDEPRTWAQTTTSREIRQLGLRQNSRPAHSMGRSTPFNSRMPKNRLFLAVIYAN